MYPDCKTTLIRQWCLLPHFRILIGMNFELLSGTDQDFSSYFILLNVKFILFTFKIQLYLNKIPVISVDWVLDSTSMNTLLPVDKYLLAKVRI